MTRAFGLLQRAARESCGRLSSLLARSRARVAPAFIAAAVAASLPLVGAPRAFAFSEPLIYPEPSIAGGGGGRFFTGSPLDGFSCVVCHEGATPPEVTVRGFPEFFEAGKKYEVELSWSDPEKPHALNLEIIDMDGKAAGTIALPEPAEVDEEGRCTLSEDEATRDQVAASLVSLGERRIVSVLGCGAQSLKFTFEAPDERRVALTAAVVRSNQKEDTRGDGVLALRRISRQEGAVGTPISGCTSSPTRPLSCLPILFVLAYLRVRRRHGLPQSRRDINGSRATAET